MGGSKIIAYPTYSGTAPYGFISYAHADADRVLPVIGALGADRYRLWYDGGIEAGTNWPEVVASHLSHAGAVVFFLSARFLRSQNCVREVHYAVAERKAMILVYLEPVALPEDLAMQFSTAAVIRGEDFDSLRIARETEELLGPAFLGDGVSGYEAASASRQRRNGWHGASILFASLFLLTVLFVIGYFAGWFPFLGTKVVTTDAPGGVSTESAPVEITEFKDSVSQDILLRAYEGQNLYLCGSYMVSDHAAIRYAGGLWYVGDAPAAAGRPEVLALAAQKGELKHLALVNEGIETFDTLSDLSRLVYLDISGNPVKDLSFLTALSELETLKLIDIGAEDFSVLAALPALKTVYVDYNALKPVLDVLGDGTVDVIVKR